jgi:hypothetical protein
MSALEDQLFWINHAELEDLNTNIELNLDRYKRGDFNDLATQPSWKRTPLLNYDATKLVGLSGKSSNENADMKIFYSQFSELKPRLARCINTWVGLTHTHLLEYGRERWLKNPTDDKALIASIRKHFFAGSRNGVRDDNAAGRLWWTAYIGHRIASGDSTKIGEVMTPLMRTTDTRQATIERPGIFNEPRLAHSISNYLAKGHYPEAAANEAKFREFVKNIGFYSNGRYFGDMSHDDIFEFLKTCR